MKKSKHGHSTNGQESWGRDSGARDLSPHRPNSSTGGSQMTENETDQAAAVDSLELRRSEHGRRVLEQQLRDSLQDRERLHRQLESMAATHESRITEMHCIIVELSKKLKTKEDGTIAEEPEGSVSELSFQEGSVYNSDMEEVLAVDSQTEPLETRLQQQTELQSACNESLASFPNLLPAPHFMVDSSSLNKIDVLQDEVLELRAQVALLESQLAAATNTKEVVDSEPRGEDLVMPVPTVAGQNVATTVPKMAERVKLKRTNEEDPDTIQKSGEVAQHLVGAQLYENVAGGASPEDVQQLQVEVRQMQRRLEHLRVQNTILSLTLAESKQHCDQLYLLCGKYESNAIALQQALNYSDRAIEAYDVMLALFESRLDIVQNNPGGVKNKEDAETVAKSLLHHLDGESDVQTSCNSLGLRDILMYSEKCKEATGPWTKEDDYRLRSHISKLKGYRASVKNTIVTLESPFYEATSSSGSLDSPSTTKRMDLETAVLMQELMNMTQRAEQAEHEKRATEEQLKSLQEALLQLQGQMMDFAGRVPLNSVSSEPSVEMERELVDALARESRLKARLQGLAGSVEAATKSSQEKYSQVQVTVAELKHANQSLNHSLEKCKRKYEAKVKKLESKLQDLSLRNGQTCLPPSPGLSTQRTVGCEAVTSLKVRHKGRTPQNVPETTL